MINYAVRNSAGVLTPLNYDGVANPLAGSLTFLSEEFTLDTKLIENSFLPGATQIGSSRLQSRTLPFVASFTFPDTGTMRPAINGLLEALRGAEWLVDVTNDLRMRVELDANSISYTNGGHRLDAEISFTLQCLRPFWEDNTPVQSVDALSSGTLNTLT